MFLTERTEADPRLGVLGFFQSFAETGWQPTRVPPRGARSFRAKTPKGLNSLNPKCDGLDLHGPGEACAVLGERAVTRSRGGARTLPTAAHQPGALRCRLCGGLRQFSRVCKHAEREVALGPCTFVLVARAWRTHMVGCRMQLKNSRYVEKALHRRHARVGLHPNHYPTSGTTHDTGELRRRREEPRAAPRRAAHAAPHVDPC